MPLSLVSLYGLAVTSDCQAVRSISWLSWGSSAPLRYMLIWLPCEVIAIFARVVKLRPVKFLP